MTSQTGQQLIIIHITQKDIQAVKFVQLIKYSKINIFLQKSRRR